MSNVCAVQTTVDGPRNVICKVDIDCDTSDLTATDILDPASLSATQPPTNQLAIWEIQYAVEDGWYVTLWWDATADKRICDLAGRGIFLMGTPFGGWQNNAGSGKTGKIQATTTGYTTGTMAATLTIHAIKQTV